MHTKHCSCCSIKPHCVTLFFFHSPRPLAASPRMTVHILCMSSCTLHGCMSDFLSCFLPSMVAAKLVIVSSNCPPVRKSEIEYYAMLSKTGVHHYSGSESQHPSAIAWLGHVANRQPQKGRFGHWLLAVAACKPATARGPADSWLASTKQQTAQRVECATGMHRNFWART